MLVGPRVPSARIDGESESEARDPDGQSGALERGRAPNQRMDSSWRDRSRARGAHLDEPSAWLLAAAGATSDAAGRAAARRECAEHVVESGTRESHLG